MLNNYFDNLDNPEHLHSVINDISSVEDMRTLSDILKILSQKIQYHEISSDHAETLKNVIIKRQTELVQDLKNKRNNGKVKTMQKQKNYTSVSNRVGSAYIVFLVANIAVTTVMYTLLFISHFLNN